MLCLNTSIFGETGLNTRFYRDPDVMILRFSRSCLYSDSSSDKRDVCFDISLRSFSVLIPLIPEHQNEPYKSATRAASPNLLLPATFFHRSFGTNMLSTQTWHQSFRHFSVSIHLSMGVCSMNFNSSSRGINFPFAETWHQGQERWTRQNPTTS